MSGPPKHHKDRPVRGDVFDWPSFQGTSTARGGKIIARQANAEHRAGVRFIRGKKSHEARRRDGLADFYGRY